MPPFASANGFGSRLVGAAAMALGFVLLVRHNRWDLWPLLRFPTETDELIFAYLAGIGLVVGGYFLQIRGRVHAGVAILGTVYTVFAVICITSLSW